MPSKTPIIEKICGVILTCVMTIGVVVGSFVVIDQIMSFLVGYPKKETTVQVMEKEIPHTTIPKNKDGMTVCLAREWFTNVQEPVPSAAIIPVCD